MIRRLIALLALLCLMAASAAAQTQALLFGGRGEEAILGAAGCGGGVFVAGYTYSTDGDLSMRTREGKTGWAALIGADGALAFSCCSAHVGRDEMTAPYAHADGTFSCLLTGEGKGAEWLRLSAQGKVLSRADLPQDAAFCPHEQGARRGRRLFYDARGEAALALEALHADGSSCMARMDESGDIRPGMPYQEGRDRILVPLFAGGELASLRTHDAGAAITWVAPGGDRAPQVCAVPMEEGVLEWILSAVSCEDGSVIFGGQLAGGGGVLVRVSREGETLFSVRTSDVALSLALTDFGFAAQMTQEILFFSEDGALQGIEPIRPAQDAAAQSLFAGFGGGVAVIENLEGSKTRQISVTAVADYTEDAADVYQGIDNLRFLEPGSEIAAAAQEEGGLLLRLGDRHGQSRTVRLDAAGSASSAQAVFPDYDGQTWPLEDGLMRWMQQDHGTCVTRTDAAGNVLFSTRVVIHTAADSAQWLCMARAQDGGFLLGGRYLTQEGPEALQQGVIARISEDGVLREIQTVEGLGCVCAMLPAGGDVLLLGAASPQPRLEADVLTKLGSAPHDWQVLSVFLDARCAWIFPAQDGAVYAVGTSRRNGRTTAVVMEMPAP